ncbi:MAG: hypothetical protein K2W82_12390 [Candidatus Obscuribacterales bacterium]|nr:hypothetical protein [Candidatus Obscuribacterales bacterium]
MSPATATNTVLSVAITAALLYLLNWFYLDLGGLPQSMPGLTEPEIKLKLRLSDFKHAVIFVGDSRVGWGLAEKIASEILSQQKPALHAINAGLAATNIVASVDHLLSYHCSQPGILAINYSPACFYTFDSPILEEKNRFNFGQLLEKEIRYLIQERICFFLNGKTFLRLIQHPNRATADVGWTDRKIYSDGFVQARLVGPGNLPLDPSVFQLHFYKDIIDKIIQNQPAAVVRREAVITKLKEAKNKGWKIVIIRLPVGPKMRQLENKLPPALQPEAICQELTIPFIDAQNLYPENVTIDQSHIRSSLVPKVTAKLTKELCSLNKAGGL